MKENYDKLMIEEIASLKTKPNLLLHTCCGPCSTATIERLKTHFNLTILYYNPNIEPYEEYLKRKQEQIRYLNSVDLPYYDIDYLNEEFASTIKGLEGEKEGGARCSKCFYLRLDKTAQIASKLGVQYFCTSLTVSPHKDSQIINQIGQSLEQKYQVKWLKSDFKKQNGYLKSVKMAKAHDLYRQEYCGCSYSQLIDKKMEDVKDEN